MIKIKASNKAATEFFDKIERYLQDISDLTSEVRQLEDKNRDQSEKISTLTYNLQCANGLTEKYSKDIHELRNENASLKSALIDLRESVSKTDEGFLSQLGNLILTAYNRDLESTAKMLKIIIGSNIDFARTKVCSWWSMDT
jgi:uncharacterized coiled-coil DUF342 family protein